MNKKTIISKISARTGIKKQVVSDVLSGLYDTILSELQKGENLSFSGFGKFSTRQRQSRKYISFQTGETFVAPEKLIPQLKFSEKFMNKF